MLVSRVLQKYNSKVLNVAPSNLCAYWPQSERQGSIAYDISGRTLHGAYVGPTLAQPGVVGMGFTCPYFDGVNDYNNIYSVGLNTILNGAELTFGVWLKPTSGWWTDGNTYVLASARVDDSNIAFEIYKGANNTLTFIRSGGAVIEATVVGGYSSEDWAIHLVTASESAGADGEFKAYSSGAQVGATRTSLGAYVGVLDPAKCVIGAETTVPAFPLKGWIGPGFIYNKVLTLAQIAHLSTV